jgi:polysaccharide biosynthesis transport protein
MQQEGILQIVWRQRRMVALTAAVCLLLGCFYLLVAPRSYTSTARIYVQPQARSSMEEAEDPRGNYVQTQAVLMRSATVLIPAIGTPGFREMRTFGRVEDVLDDLQEKLEVSPGKNDDTLVLTFQGRYPDEAAAIVNTVIDSYIEHHAQRQNSAAELLRREKVRWDDELTVKSGALLELKRKHRTLSFDDERRHIERERLATLAAALSRAHVQEVEARAAFDEAVKVLGDDAEKLRKVEQPGEVEGLVLSSESQELLQDALLQWQHRLDDFRRTYGPEHPTLQAVQGRVEQLQIAYVVAAKRRWEAAVQRERELHQSFERQQSAALELASTAGEGVALEAEVARIQSLSDALAARINELSLNEQIGALSVNVWEPARPAERPTSPRAARTLGLSLVLGLLLGSGLALLRDSMDLRIRSPEEVKGLLGLPVLGAVPHMSDDKTPEQAAHVVHSEPWCEAAEAYRTIRTAVYFAVSEHEVKTLLVTSPFAADGKTTLASNLAIAMAKAGRRTLLLDADWRKPMQHQLFSLVNRRGVSTLVRKGAALSDEISPSGIDGLDVLPCGPLPPDPAETLNRPAFAQLIRLLRERYDQVIIDAPPVMPVADARILATLADATLLVLRAKKSTRNTSVYAHEALAQVGAKLLGVVMNDVSHDLDWYSYYGYGQEANRRPEGFRQQVSDVLRRTFDAARRSPALQGCAGVGRRVASTCRMGGEQARRGIRSRVQKQKQKQKQKK